MECRILQIKDYSLGYKSTPPPPSSPKNISLTLDAGEIALIIGLEKSGKSRLLAAVAGNIPSQGEILISSAQPGTPEAKQLVGYVPAIDSLYAELTCLQYLGMFSEIFGVERHYRPYIIRESLALVHLEGYEETLIGDLEDDYKRRCLCLARALVHDPRLLVIDEVLTNVDHLHIKSFLDILNNIRRRGKALLLSGSQLGDFAELADQLCYLENGYMFLQGRNADLQSELANYHLFQMQTLNAQIGYKAMAYMKKFSDDARVISLRRNVLDSTKWRVVFRGHLDEFNSCVEQMNACGMRVVSCWENRSFFGQVI